MTILQRLSVLPLVIFITHPALAANNVELGCISEIVSTAKARLLKKLIEACALTGEISLKENFRVMVAWILKMKGRATKAASCLEKNGVEVRCGTQKAIFTWDSGAMTVATAQVYKPLT